jgi:hypothetical protein
MLMIISLHEISVAVEIVVTITFQSDFYLEMYQDNIFFYFLKFIFDISEYFLNTKQIHLFSTSDSTSTCIF